MLNKKINSRPNKIFLIIMGMLLFHISSGAANAENLCHNPSGKIIKKICAPGFLGDRGLLLLDNSESLIYEFALFSTKKSSGLKESQRQWIKKRDACRDMNCATKAPFIEFMNLQPSLTGTPTNRKAQKIKI